MGRPTSAPRRGECAAMALRISTSPGALALALALIATAPPAHAQQVAAPPPDTSAAVDAQSDPQSEIVVTGSYVRGAAQNGAVPINVVTSDDLAKIGTPTIADLTRQLPASTGSDGESNNFNSSGLEGTSNINLRGLGPARTLVLWNGRRIAQNPRGTSDGQFFVDTNLLPVAAVQRIEVLKDGAAALYGSDAVAGVVNFISNRRLKGLVLSADDRLFDGTDGDVNASAAYGWQGTTTSVLASFGYGYRSKVATRDLPFTLGPASRAFENGYSSTGNPGVIRQVGGSGIVADPGCALVGGTQGPNFCYIQVTEFEAIVNEEKHYQGYVEVTQQIGGVEAHLEGLYAKTDVPNANLSPSFPPGRPTFFVPASSPGLVALLADNPALVASTPFLQPGAVAATGGVNVTARPFGYSGNPVTGFEGPGSREFETHRIVGSFTGKFGADIDWTASATYETVQARETAYDTFAQRFSRAVAGFGGPNCAGTVPGANGCLFFNPFSNAIAVGAVNGRPNPQFRPELANSRTLTDYISGTRGQLPRNQLLVIDAILSGQSGIELPGGEIGFALGLQYRRDWYSNRGLNAESDATINPCPTPGDTSCASRTGLFNFSGPVSRVNLTRDVKAAFGELNVPVFPRFQAQLAVRYEDYGGGVGSTVDPKAAARWEPIDGLVLRGSVSTTFRGPQLSQLEGTQTTNQLIAPTGSFKAIDTDGNPNLSPEKSFSYNLGAVFQSGGFRASIDYFNFRFRSPIIVEPFSFIVSNVLAGLASGTPSPLLDRVTFNDANGNGVNEPSEIERVRIQYANGPKVRTDGIDGLAEYRFDIGRFVARVGAEASYQFNYDVEATFVEGLQVAAAFDGVGRLNLSTAFVRPLPQWKGNAFAEFGGDDFNVRYTLRHTTDYEDERFSANPSNLGAQIDAFTTHDLTAFVDTPMGLRLSASVINFTDEEPPYVRSFFNYDTYTAYPFGRTFKFGASASF